MNAEKASRSHQETGLQLDRLVKVDVKMPQGKIPDADLKYLYGWRFGTTVIKEQLVQFDPLTTNIVSGMTTDHHCPVCDKPPKKSCYHDLHLAYCCEINNNNKRIVDGRQVERIICGVRFVPRSTGCGTHPFINGHNLFLKRAWKGEVYELPTDIPHVPQPSDEDISEANNGTRQPENPEVIVNTGSRSVKRPKASRNLYDDDTGKPRTKPRTKKDKNTDNWAVASTEAQEGAEEDDLDIPDEAKIFKQNNPNSKREWYETHKDYQEYKEKNRPRRLQFPRVNCNLRRRFKNGKDKLKPESE